MIVIITMMVTVMVIVMVQYIYNIDWSTENFSTEHGNFKRPTP